MCECDTRHFDLDEAIKDKCDLTIAKAIMERFKGDNNLLCDSIVDIATMMSNEDKQWLVNTISRFIKKENK
jgi:hypothetical protein